MQALGQLFFDKRQKQKKEDSVKAESPPPLEVNPSPKDPEGSKGGAVGYIPLDEENYKQAFNNPIKIQGIKTDDVVKDGVKEALKEEIKSEAKNKQKIDTLSNLSHELFRMETVFPFKFFPTILTIDTLKVNIDIKNFFLSKSRESLVIKDLAEVRVENGPFFATLYLVNRIYIENVIIIRYLKKQDARMARQLIQGLLTAQAQDIDLSKIEKGELRQKVIELGRIQSME